MGLAVIFTATIYLNAFFYPFFILNSDINSEILIRKNVIVSQYEPAARRMVLKSEISKVMHKKSICLK